MSLKKVRNVHGSAFASLYNGCQVFLVMNILVLIAAILSGNRGQLPIDLVSLKLLLEKNRRR